MEKHRSFQPPLIINIMCVLLLNLLIISSNYCAGQSGILKNNEQLLSRDWSSLEDLKILVQLLQETHDYGQSRLTADIHSRMGKVFEANGLYEHSLTHYTEAYVIYSEFSIKDPACAEGAMWTLYDIGNVFYHMVKYENAIAIYSKSASRFLKKEDYYGVASSFSNIGLCYSMMEKHDSALTYYNKALDIRSYLQDSNLVAFSLTQIGSLHINTEDWEEAEQYYKKAAEIQLVAGNYKSLVISYMNLGRIYSSLNNDSLAESFYNKSLQLADSINHKEYQTYVFSEKARLYEKKGRYSEALEILKNAVSLAEQTGIIPLKRMIYHRYYEFAYSREDYKTALEFLLLYNEQDDLIFNRETETKLKQMEFLIMSEQLQQEMKNMEKENHISLLQSRNRSNLLYYFIFSSIILILFALGNVRKFNYRFKLLGDFLAYLSLFELVMVILSVAVYFALFFYLFTPFGLESSVYSPGLLSHFITGIIFSLNLMVVLWLFAWIERKILFAWFVKHRYIVMSVVINLTTAFSVMIYLNLFAGLPTGWYLYFSLVLFTLTAYILPLYIIIIIIEKYLLKKNVTEARKLNEEFKSRTNESKSLQHPLILKSNLTKEELVFDAESVLYIEAQGNYCRVCRFEEGELKKTMIRLTMKLAEEQCKNHPQLARCHKSFIVNTSHIVRITGNSRGYLLIMQNVNEQIPLSKHFYNENLMKK